VGRAAKQVFWKRVFTLERKKAQNKPPYQPKSEGKKERKGEKMKWVFLAPPPPGWGKKGLEGKKQKKGKRP